MWRAALRTPILDSSKAMAHPPSPERPLPVERGEDVRWTAFIRSLFGGSSSGP